MASMAELSEWLRERPLPEGERLRRAALRAAHQAVCRARVELAPHGLTVYLWRKAGVSWLRLEKMSATDMQMSLASVAEQPVGSREHLRRTRCRFGHVLEGANLYVLPQGTRVCVTCRGASHKAWKQRSVARAAPAAVQAPPEVTHGDVG